MADQTLGDKGLSILTFAAYHQLTSGEQVSEVILRDDAGHSADPQGIREVEGLGLAKVEGNKAVLTDEGKSMLEHLLQQIRGVSKHASSTSAVA